MCKDERITNTVLVTLQAFFCKLQQVAVAQICYSGRI